MHPKPDFVVLNAGLWNHDLTPEVYSEIQTTADEVGIAVIYKTTTKLKLERNASLLP